MIEAIRYHDFSAGHRVVNHESKCAHLHGHNYRVFFHVTAKELDDVGRVLDFSVIKERLAMWLEDNWDHKMLIWEKDPLLKGLLELDPTSIVVVDFNPTAENMAEYLVTIVAPKQLKGLNAVLSKVEVSETRKCSVTYTKS